MKKLMAFVFVVLAAVLFTVGSVTASEIAQNGQISVTANDRILGTSNNADSPIAVFAGETIPIKVGFIASEDASDVVIKTEIRGYANDIGVRSAKFNTIQGNFYTKTLNLQIPFDLKDKLNDHFTVDILVYNDHDQSERTVSVEIQRQSYDLAVLSIDTDQKATAGQTFAVDVVLKNKGMEKLQDLFVTARIPALGIERRAYFDEVFALENRSVEDTEKDTVHGKIYLTIPDDAVSGSYDLEVTAQNDEASVQATKKIVVENKFTGENIVAPITGRIVVVGEESDFKVLIVNPSNTLKVYTIIPETSKSLDVSTDETVVAVPAGSSKEVSIKVTANEEGTQPFGVNVYSGNELVKRVQITANAKASTTANATTSVTSNPIVALTIVLAIIFVVLLVVLIVLLARKPQKTEEFGESYY